MPINTTFGFDHFTHGPMPLANNVVQPDLLGLLRGFVGQKKHQEWRGHGFNLIWRPNFNNKSGAKDFFLELNNTSETLDFTNITGSGVANRGELQDDIGLGAIAYLQQVTDRFDNSHQHFEPGVWANVPSTVRPAEPATVNRMGSIPHGTTINLEGVAFSADAPVFQTASITPFTKGSVDDGKTNLVHFPEEQLENLTTSRTPLAQLAGLTPAHLTNPNLFLSEAIATQKITNTAVILVASNVSLLPAGLPAALPDSGGGETSIPFLTGGNSVVNENANVPAVSATFWIEEWTDHHGKKLVQLQYTQRVLLNFNGLSWPHISVATLHPV